MLIVKASVVVKGLEIMYVLFGIANVMLLKLAQPEHCATLSTHTLISEVWASSSLVTPPSKNLVAKPIRLPVKLMPVLT